MARYVTTIPWPDYEIRIDHVLEPLSTFGTIEAITRRGVTVAFETTDTYDLGALVRSTEHEFHSQTGALITIPRPERSESAADVPAWLTAVESVPDDAEVSVQLVLRPMTVGVSHGGRRPLRVPLGWIRSAAQHDAP